MEMHIEMIFMLHMTLNWTRSLMDSQEVSSTSDRNSLFGVGTLICYLNSFDSSAALLDFFLFLRPMECILNQRLLKKM